MLYLIDDQTVGIRPFCRCSLTYSSPRETAISSRRAGQVCHHMPNFATASAGPNQPHISLLRALQSGVPDCVIK